MSRKMFLSLFLMLGLFLAACSSTPTTPIPPTQVTPVTGGDHSIYFVIGSENESVMQNIVQPWFSQQGWTANYVKMGSVDQKIMLQSGEMVDTNGVAFNVMWPANKAWALIGDTHHLLVDNPNAVFYTPIVVAGRPSMFQELGWTENTISVSELLTAVQAGRQLWTSNPTQSNSGAVFMIGLANGFAGNDSTTPLSEEQVNNQDVLDQLQAFYTQINHSASSTGFVTNNCLVAPNCDLLVTYETLVIQYNQTHANDPLSVKYVSDAFLYSDATPQFIRNGFADDAVKQDVFNQFLAYMQTPEAEQQLIALGERPARNGLRLDENDAAVRAIFNPAWGIQPTLTLQPITLPEGSVIERLFYNYQVVARPAYDLVMCLDRSGSMDGDKWQQLITGLGYISDQDQAAAYQLLAHPNDLTTLVTFSGDIGYTSPAINGADYTAFQTAYDTIVSQGIGGGTNIFGCLSYALDLFAQHPQVEGQQHLLVLMTDGMHTETTTIDDYLNRAGNMADLKVIVVGIGSDVDLAQLHRIVDPRQGLLIITSRDIRASQWNEVNASSILEAMRQTVGSR